MTGRGNIRNLEGMRFGRLVVTGEHKRVKYTTRWKCVCDCGCVKFVIGTDLTRGATRSCGCFQKELVTSINKARAIKQAPT